MATRGQDEGNANFLQTPSDDKVQKKVTKQRCFLTFKGTIYFKNKCHTWL